MRPPDLELVESGPLAAKVEVREPLGSEVYLHLAAPLEGWTVRVDAHAAAREGETIQLAPRPTALHLFDREDERSLLS